MLVGLVLAAPAPARAQESVTSETVEFVKHIPFDLQSAIASDKHGDYLYLTGTRAISIYDVSQPLDPQLVGHMPLGYEWQNEDVSTNGKLLLVSESLPGDVLHVWDVTDPELPSEIGRLLFAGNHTMECLHDCTWAYGSEGDIADLRDPEAPVLAGNWMEKVGFSGGVHDVNEVRPGLAIVATYDQDFLLLDVEDPANPRIVGTGPHPEPEAYILHQLIWPRRGADKLLLASGEGGEGPILSFRNVGTGADPKFEPAGRYTLGTTSHWFDPHPRFSDGGLLAVGWYGQGTRILEVAPSGEITEVGHYNPGAGTPIDRIPPHNTWAARWISDDIVYAIDNGRGIDVLRYTGGIPEPLTLPPVAAAVPPAAAAPPSAPPKLGGLRARGRRLSFRLSAPARVTFTLTRRGRRVRSFAVEGRAGANRARLPRLSRGTYRLVARPRGGRAVTLRFRLR